MYCRNTRYGEASRNCFVKCCVIFRKHEYLKRVIEIRNELAPGEKFLDIIMAIVMRRCFVEPESRNGTNTIVYCT